MANPITLLTPESTPVPLLPWLEVFSQLEGSMGGVLELLALAQSTHAPCMTTRQAAEYLSLSPRTLEQYRWKGGGPTYSTLGRLIRYRKADLIAWAGAQRRCSTTRNVTELRTRGQLAKAA